MIAFPAVTSQSIRFHYDLSTLFYRLLWGRHIHHGLWQADESPRVAQLQLTETLAALAGVQPGQAVLDVGCGMGGSAMHLARRGCDVTGVTLSPVQRAWAAVESRLRGLGGRVTWVCADAERLECPPESFDLLWSIECTEHLFNKPEFFRRAAQWLKPGGRVAICAWLAGERTDPAAIRRVEEVCQGFLCPSLGTAADYCGWFEAAGLVVEQNRDWTAQVARTWEICERRVQRFGIRHLAKLVDRDTRLFLERFGTILEAYRDGSMQYGALVARKAG